MKRQFFSFLLLVSLGLSVSAQTNVQPALSAPGQPSIEAALRSDITYLASDKLEGRRTGEAGADLAASYIAKRFARIGLKPGYRDPDGTASYKQPFPYVTGVEKEDAANAFSMELTLPTNSRQKLYNLSTAQPVGFSPNGSAHDCPVVFAGFGITSQELKFDDYRSGDKDLDVRGKIVLVFDGTPDNDNPHSPFQKFDPRTKALIARDHGAAAVLLISREPILDNDRLTRLTYDQSMGEAALPTFVISRSMACNMLGVQADRLQAIEDQTASKATSPNVHVDYVDTDPVVSFQVGLVKKQVPAWNIIGVLPGTDPALKDEVIVLGAHYDHLGHGGQGSLAANSTEIHHGADDNASGDAAVMELARRAVAAHNNKRTLVFMAFSGEEEGLIGSQYYVNNPVFPLDKTIAMINLDMVGRLNNNKLTVGGIGTATEFRSLVEGKDPVAPGSGNGVSMGATIGHLFDLQLNDDGFGPSDHSSFYGKKVPVLFFFTGSHNDYHKPTDTADKINYAGEVEVVDYIDSIERTIDDNPARPSYTVAKSTGTGTGRMGFNVSLGTIPNYADTTAGMLIDGVRDDSPASRAGLKAGDRVVRLDGHDVRNVMDYTYVLGTLKAGQEYVIEIVRGTEHITTRITPVKR